MRFQLQTIDSFREKWVLLLIAVIRRADGDWFSG
jgi:hypothetical protein